MPTELKKIAWMRICSSRSKGDGKNSLQYAGPIYIDSAQMASLLLLQRIHAEHKNHKLVFQMDDCIPLKVVVLKTSVLPQEWQTRECCYECFSEHEKNNQYGPHDCEVRTKKSLEPVPNIGGGADKKDLVIRGLPISLAACKIAVKPSSVNALTATTKTAA